MPRCVAIPRSLTHQQQRRVPQFHPLARLNRQRSHLRSLYAGDQPRNTIGNRHAVFVELVLPQQTRQHSAPQLRLGANRNSGRTLMSAQRCAGKSKLADIQ